VATPSTADPAAILARAEHVVRVLSRNAVIDSRFADEPSWHPAWFDDASAERMLSHLRREAEGAPVTDESFEAIKAFCEAHHQSIGYIVTGNVDCLIGWAASCSPATYDDFAA
jgi:hypothetical protein